MAKSKKKNYSLASQGLGYKLRISFYLMSILPLLVSLYLVSSYILPLAGIRIDVAVSIIVSISIAAIGFFLIKQVFDRILSVSNAAKLIAGGDINRKVDIAYGDEVGDLGSALNQLTSRIRTNMDELESYSEKTSVINIEIQERVLVLSSILQVSSMISQGAKLDEILKLTVEKSRLLAGSDSAYLLYKQEGRETFFVRAAEGINSQKLLSIKLETGNNLVKKLAKLTTPFILDRNSLIEDNLKSDFREKFHLTNTLALAVYLKGEVIAILGIGNNNEEFVYRKDDKELLDIFAKQVTIAVENDMLAHKVEKLEIKDVLTGLYNQEFIRNRLREEIKRAIAYQRPCSFILLDIDNFAQFHQSFGSLQAESALKKIASLVRDSVSEVDRVARFGDDDFAVVLPEKNKRQALEIAENIRKKIEAAFSQEQDQNKKLTVSGSVSENPLDGTDAEELISKARSLLGFAKIQGKNRVNP